MLKPIELDTLRKVMEKVAATEPQRLIDIKQSFNKVTEYRRKLMLPVSTGLKFVSVDDIVISSILTGVRILSTFVRETIETNTEQYMNQRILLMMLLSMVAMVAKSWDGDRKHFRVEVGLGPEFGANHVADLHNRIGGMVYAEADYAFSAIPITVGLNVSRSVFSRQYKYRVTDDSGMLTQHGAADVNFWSTNYMVTADYYVDIKRNVQFFAGAAVGMCKVKFTNEVEVEPIEFGVTVGDSGTSGTAAFVPRIGLIVNNLRLTIGYKLQEKANRAAFLSAGYIFRF